MISTDHRIYGPVEMPCHLTLKRLIPHEVEGALMGGIACTDCIDAVDCARGGGGLCSVSVCVGHDRQPRKNRSADRDKNVDSCEPKKHVWGLEPHGKEQFWG